MEDIQGKFESFQSQLSTVHKQVLSNFTYNGKELPLSYHWQLPDDEYDVDEPFTGDAEDFALACRQVCLELEIMHPRLCYVENSEGKGHIVAEVCGFVFDCLLNDVISGTLYQRAGNEFIAASGFNFGDPWYKLKI